MDNVFVASTKLKNLENPFTELFSLLKQYEDYPWASRWQDTLRKK